MMSTKEARILLSYGLFPTKELFFSYIERTIAKSAKIGQTYCSIPINGAYDKDLIKRLESNGYHIINTKQTCTICW